MLSKSSELKYIKGLLPFELAETNPLFKLLFLVLCYECPDMHSIISTENFSRGNF